VNGSFLIILVLMFAVLYFLLIRPQRAQQRRHAELLEGLKVGDEVVTAGGIYGEVTEVDAERVLLEVDEDVRIAVAKRAIASIVPPEEIVRLEGGEAGSAAVDEEAPEASAAEAPAAAEEPAARK
jgi:preprotein translocase subunit YajC